jgi:hypothetical protein
VQVGSCQGKGCQRLKVYIDSPFMTTAANAWAKQLQGLVTTTPAHPPPTPTPPCL